MTFHNFTCTSLYKHKIYFEFQILKFDLNILKFNFKILKFDFKSATVGVGVPHLPQSN